MWGLLTAAQKVAGIFSDDVANGIQTAIDVIDGGIPEVQFFQHSVERAGGAMGDMAAAADMAAEESDELSESTKELSAELEGVEGGADAAARELSEYEKRLQEAIEASDKTHGTLREQRQIATDVAASYGELALVTDEYALTA